MRRTYLFLQGPHGPFFKQLGQALVDRGHRVLRINLNGGDKIDWSGSMTRDYTGTYVAWPAYVASVMENESVTDLVLYGDCRQSHREAIQQAREREIKVYAFEEGYIRPNWVTLEEGGVNGHSDLPKDPEWYLQQSEDVRATTSERVGPSMRWIVLYCLRHYLFKTLHAVRFKHYIRHRPYRPAQELLLWVFHLFRIPLLKWRDQNRVAELQQCGRPYFLVGLQLDSDAQVRCHSPFLSVAEFLNYVIRSFAMHAPPETVLAIKKHPHDPNGVSYETLAMLEAYSLGIRERVVFLQTGPLPILIRDAEGVIVNNSTVGTSALHHGTPTIALGDAVYDIDGLTCQGGLDAFWTKANEPKPKLVEAFRRVLLDRVLLNGGFFSPKGRSLLMDSVVNRLTRPSEPELVERPLAKVVPIAKAAQK